MQIALQRKVSVSSFVFFEFASRLGAIGFGFTFEQKNHVDKKGGKKCQGVHKEEGQRSEGDYAMTAKNRVKGVKPCST